LIEERPARRQRVFLIEEKACQTPESFLDRGKARQTPEGFLDRGKGLPEARAQRVLVYRGKETLSGPERRRRSASGTFFVPFAHIDRLVRLGIMLNKTSLFLTLLTR
jgi:hypothetical protein